jgi:hypothetical protein
MPVTIHAVERALFKIFNNDFAFAIPPYQRPYAWTTDQASELLSDLLGSLEEGKRQVEDLNPYFLGSIVLIKKEDDPEADIIDGQQRLTTLTILLSVLRAKSPAEYADELTKYIYEKGDIIVGTHNRYRLRLRERDYEFFQNYIQNDQGVTRLLSLEPGQLTDSQKNIQANAKYFFEKLENLPEAARIRLIQFLMKRCFLVVVSTPDLDSAYRIFSVLNARGLDLRLTDLLKAEIIGAIPKEYQGRYTHIWETEEEELGRDTFQELFAHIRMIYRKTKLRETALSEYLTQIQPQKEPRKFIDETLKPYSDSLEIIKNSTYQSERGAENVNAMLCWLNKIDNFDWIPPAIKFFHAHQHNPDRLGRYFTDLERLAAGLLIMRADINDRIERYGKLLTAIEEGADLYAAQSPLQLTPSETSEIIRILNGDLYLVRRIRLYILLRLDSVLARGEATYEYPVVSVEHVLPQNPSAGSRWLEWFPDEEMRARYTHRIGNLALLSIKKNTQAQNYDFDKKKEKYFATKNGVSPFVLTTQVLNKKEWTPAVIDNRQKEMGDVLKALWRL